MKPDTPDNETINDLIRNIPCVVVDHIERTIKDHFESRASDSKDDYLGKSVRDAMLLLAIYRYRDRRDDEERLTNELLKFSESIVIDSMAPTLVDELCNPLESPVTAFRVLGTMIYANAAIEKKEK